MVLLVFFGIFLLGCLGKWTYESWKDKKEADDLDMHNNDWL